MRLYHGSYCKIARIDLDCARKYKDFGSGFYLTPDYQRSVKMAMRSVLLNNHGSPEVNAYIFNRALCPTDFKIKEFKSCNWEWAAFVMNNRDKTLNPPYSHGYDIVIGPVADSSVDPIIRQYRNKFGKSYLEPNNLKVLAEQLKYPGERYIQYVGCSV